MGMGRSTEALKGAPAEESVFQHGTVFGVKGQKFQREFMANFVLPFRRELATLVVAGLNQRDGVQQDPESMCSYAFELADRFIEAEFDTLDVERYFKLYMEGPASKDMGEILKAAVDRVQDYSL